jgi:hypothetical protein
MGPGKTGLIHIDLVPKTVTIPLFSVLITEPKRHPAMRIQASIVLLSICLSAASQAENLPEKVKSVFNSRYPGLAIDDWSCSDSLYSIDFYKGGTMYTAVYNSDGVWLETSEIISDMDLPAPLQDYIKKNYPNSSISYSEKVEGSDKTRFLRVNLYYNETSCIIRSDLDGKNTRAQEVKPVI